MSVTASTAIAMPSDSLQSLVRDVLQRARWETELDNPGYARPLSGSLPSIAPIPSQSMPAHAQTAQSATSAPPPRHQRPPTASRPVVGDSHRADTTVLPAEIKSEVAPSPLPEQTVATKRVVEQARAHALAELKFRLEKCTACDLCNTRSRIVFSDGTMSADIAFVGDAPSRDEDLVSLPFVGERGHLLNKIIVAIGLRRENSYLCNVIKCYPGAARTPSTTEVSTCEKFLFEQLAHVSPRVIVALGQTAASALLGVPDELVTLRGNFYQWRGISVMPTWSLDSMLKTPALKRDVWNDLKQVKALLEKQPS